MANSSNRPNRIDAPESALKAIGTACFVAACAAASLTALVLLLLPRDWASAQRIELVGLLVGFAALGGGVLEHSLRRGRAGREEAQQRRYHSLLGIAADWLWELDREFRFIHLSSHRDPLVDAELQERLGQTPWRLPDIGLSESQIDAHRADLEAHRPFTGLLTRRRDALGRIRVHSISGQPRFDAAGTFIGYWGVARDVTEEVRAQRAMTASETRYRELFERSPSPLLLHRNGIVFDANDAAARLFGYADAAAMSGVDVVDLFATAENREHAAARIDALERMPVGEGIPVTDYHARATDGRQIIVQATAVRVDTASGPATLSIMFDITVRQRVEAALRRSEAMLSHLFATSPDCIALSEFESGRHAMVNAAFTRVTGYTSQEMVGRTATEAGIWHDLKERDRLHDLIAEHGAVADLPVTLRSKSGARVSMLLSAARFAMDNRDYLVVNARDVTATERTRLEHAAILERASIGIAFTRDNSFIQANPRFEAMFGWQTGELAGKPGSVVWATDDDYAEIGRLAGPLLSNGQQFEIEREMRRKDGSLFWGRLMAQVVDRSHPSQGGTIWIADDVTERKRLDQALAAARDAAEAASQAKSAFLANTSHEIRTPLNGLLGLARLAMQPDLEADRRYHYLEQILDSSQGLAVILSDILDLSKIEAGKIALEDVPFDLHEALDNVHESYRAMAEQKGLAMTLAIAGDLPSTVMGDPIRVRQILSNFITNAIKFTERGSVSIEASAEAGAVRLAVVDTGSGADTATQERLFKPFSQGDSSTTRRYGGTGLGLSICRELARLMGGEVGMRSRPGQGSTFWALLPLRPAFSSGAALSTEAHDLERLRGRRVLLVEDNPVNMMVAAATLEQWGVRVSQARDGRLALDAVREADALGRPFDAVLMDVQMPVMSGHEAAAELRKRYDPAQLPIIALTAAALVSEREQALAAGMNEFLTKPIDPVRLRQTLARHVKPLRASVSP